MSGTSANTSDYIIVGGGSSGCALAARLSEDPAVRVTLVEAGPRDRNPLIRVPALIIPLVNGTFCNWKYWSEPQANMYGRRLYQPRGKVLGGCSSINAQVYVRGNPADYDRWAAAGCEGWSWREVLPYFLKLEDFTPDTGPAGAGLHGRGGPLTVGRSAPLNPLTRSFLEAAEAAGYRRNDDHNGAEQEGIGIFYSYHRKGQRCSNAMAYLDPARRRPNLEVVTGALVSRILIDKGRAIGVETRRGGSSEKLLAGKEVIVSAGAFNSPQLLMLSGIGPEQELRRHGIPVACAAPGVGGNLQDHLNLYVETLSKTREGLSFRTDALPRLLLSTLKYLFTRRGEFSSNFLEAGGFIRSSAGEDTPDIQAHFLPALGAHHGLELDNLRRHYGYSLIINDNRPRSRGRLRLSGSSPDAPPLIDPNYLDHEEDVARLVQGVRIAREILRQPAFDRHRDFELSPGDRLQTDAELADWVRRNAESVYHPAGTCRMGTDNLAVVDPQLRLYGVDGLRVADASIMPDLVSGNTNAACTMIGEKAAAMILHTPLPLPANPAGQGDGELTPRR